MEILDSEYFIFFKIQLVLNGLVWERSKLFVRNVKPKRLSWCNFVCYSAAKNLTACTDTKRRSIRSSKRELGAKFETISVNYGAFRRIGMRIDSNWSDNLLRYNEAPQKAETKSTVI